MPRISAQEKNEVSEEVQEIFTEIVEALGVMEIFTAFNKFLDSLNVGVDF